MANLTLAVPAETLRRARLKALEQGTSVNALLRERLEEYVGGPAQRATALDRFLELAKASTAGSGGRRWTRDELHER